MNQSQPVPAEDQGSSSYGTSQPKPHRLGLRENWRQFALYTLITLLIGMTIGVERVALPPLAHQAFGITSVLYVVSFLSAFGLVKSMMNLVAGRLSDRRGRKGILLVGWAFAIPYALIIIFATAWWQVIVANLFLGVNQALTWTMSVTAKIDLVGPINRGLAVGVDESAGYVGVGIGGFLAGLLVTDYGLRPTPYLLAIAVVVLGMLVTLGPAKETLHFARTESTNQAHHTGNTARQEIPKLTRLGAYMSWHDRSMFAVCQAGFLNKFADSLVAAFFPLYMLARGISLAQIGLLVGIYAWVWGVGQVATGALADRIGRKAPITLGTFFIAAGLALFVGTNIHTLWLVAMILMGAGMALAYPNLITTIGDTADPVWRGGALGVYRLWRDGGYAVGPLVLGAIAVVGGVTAAIWTGAALLAVSGLVLLTLFRETDPHRRKHEPAWKTHPEWVAPQTHSANPDP
ncbi:MAG: MFS transporter [Ferrimicrobium sp.]|uniref:MFS transporter n=1 Tax=Ferrimicrobium acidiphilum TaxID=121039 RepID=A0ABV3XYP4_9ACTN|nr:MFS transporter [Ferrimicrobium sp.]